jgi:hypothetical protein
VKGPQPDIEGQRERLPEVVGVTVGKDLQEQQVSGLRRRGDDFDRPGPQFAAVGDHRDGADGVGTGPLRHELVTHGLGHSLGDAAVDDLGERAGAF